MLKAVKRVDVIRMIEQSGIGEVVDQYFCEFVCGKGEFGNCKYFKWVGRIPVCVRRVVKKENRLVR